VSISLDLGVDPDCKIITAVRPEAKKRRVEQSSISMGGLTEQFTLQAPLQAETAYCNLRYQCITSQEMTSRSFRVYLSSSTTMLVPLRNRSESWSLDPRILYVAISKVGRLLTNPPISPRVILGLIIPGLGLTTALLALFGYAAWNMASRRYLDRVSFRLLTYALVAQYVNLRGQGYNSPCQSHLWCFTWHDLS
jgi:hypothetical protein